VRCHVAASLSPTAATSGRYRIRATPTKPTLTEAYLPQRPPSTIREMTSPCSDGGLG